MHLAQAIFMVGLLVLDGLFFWIYIVKSSRGYAIFWLTSSAAVSGVLLVLAIFQGPTALTIALCLLVGPMVIGCGLGRWRFLDHLAYKEEQAKQEELLRLKNPKVFD